MKRTLLPGIAIGWACFGVAIAVIAGGIGSGPLLLEVATVAGPLLALGAAHAARLDRVRLFGGLLVLSALVTPAYFFLVLASVPLAVGVSNFALGGLTPTRRLRWVEAGSPAS